MENDFLAFIAEIIEKDVSEVNMDLSYEDGAWDSLTHLRIMAEINEKYGVEIPIDKFLEIKTIRDFYAYVDGAER